MDLELIPARERSRVRALGEAADVRPNSKRGSLARTVGIAGGLLLATLYFLVILNRGMLHPYNHDENVFVASAYLLARHGLLPYVDYPFVHSPNLTFLYAILFRFTDHYLLVARCFSAVCDITTLGLLAAFTFRQFVAYNLAVRLFAALLAATFLLANPLFQFINAQAWNNNLSALLASLACIALLDSADHRRPHRYIAVSGWSLGVAIGTRISYAAAIPAFLLALYLHPQAKDSRHVVRFVFYFGVAGLLAMLPSLALCLLGPEQYVFGNLAYPNLNTRYWNLPTPPMSQALAYTRDYVLNDRSNRFLVVAAFVSLMPEIGLGILKRRAFEFAPLFLGSVLTLVALGALLPSPTRMHYYYAPVPLAILAIAYQAPRLDWLPAGGRIVWLTALGFSALATILPRLTDAQLALETFAAKRDWTPYRIHAESRAIFRNVPAGRILTLDPIRAIEGGRDIYPSFATGPFAFRVANQISLQQRRRLKLIGPDDLLDDVLSEQPSAIFVNGSEPREEPALDAYATQRGYERVDLGARMYMWRNRDHGNSPR